MPAAGPCAGIVVGVPPPVAISTATEHARGVRAIWKGAISFGLVSVPVKAYTATEDHDVRFHQVHAADNGRVKYNRVCRECGARNTSSKPRVILFFGSVTVWAKTPNTLPSTSCLPIP